MIRRQRVIRFGAMVAMAAALLITFWSDPPLWLLIVAALVIIPFGAIGFYRERVDRRAARRRELGRCVGCGYNLTGNTSGVCPECGTPVPQNSEAAA